MNPDESQAYFEEALGWNRLVRETSLERHIWTPDDYAAIFAHQLSAELGVELSRVGLRIEAADAPWARETLRGLLLAPDPAPGALRAIKMFAKHLRQHARLTYPEPVATALYFCALAAARRAGQNLSGLDERDIEAGFEWTAARPWLPDDLRSLFGAKP
jgi:hypothetical protein